MPLSALLLSTICIQILCLCPFFFLAHKDEKEQSAQSSPIGECGQDTSPEKTRHDHSAKGALQKFPITSETEGASPSAPKLPLRPNREDVKALAAARDRMERHRSNQYWRARARRGFGVERV